jgi:hypothetical protein
LGESALVLVEKAEVKVDKQVDINGSVTNNDLSIDVNAIAAKIIVARMENTLVINLSNKVESKCQLS